MKLFKYLVPMFFGLVLLAGCTKEVENTTPAVVEKASAPKIVAPEKGADPLAVPENMSLDAAPKQDIEK